MAIQPMVLFTKPEALGKPENRQPLVEMFEPAAWDKYKLANERIGVDASRLSAMQFFMRTLGESNGFRVLAARRGRFSEETFARHYQHTWKYDGAVEGEGWAVRNAKDYSAQPLWFFLIYGDHKRAELIRGPSDGSQARNPKSKKFAPYTIRGLYGQKKTPMMHMTAKTPYNGGALSAEECGKIEAVRFFGAGTLVESFTNWPLRQDGGETLLPRLEIQDARYDYNTMKKIFVPSTATMPGIITRMMQDFPELAPLDFVEFFARYAREFLRTEGPSGPTIAIPGRED